MPNGTASTTTAWILRAAADKRNTIKPGAREPREIDGSANILRIEVYNGETVLIGNSVEITVDARGRKRIGRILAQFASGTTQGYARVTRIAGNSPLIACVVLNDGGQPGERTGDGAFVASTPPSPVVSIRATGILRSGRLSLPANDAPITTALSIQSPAR